MRATRNCQHCAGPINDQGGGRTPRYCSGRCRVAAHRARHAPPAELRSRRQWVRRDEQKRPLTADGSPASSTDPSTWTSYAKARRSIAGVGLGFVLAADDGLAVLDLDDCLDEHGQVVDWAAEIVAQLLGRTYIETSPSGRGLHVWGYGHVDRGRNIRVPGGRVEIYSQARYIALGRRFRSSPDTLADLGEVVSALT